MRSGLAPRARTRGDERAHSEARGQPATCGSTQSSSRAWRHRNTKGHTQCSVTSGAYHVVTAKSQPRRCGLEGSPLFRVGLRRHVPVRRRGGVARRRRGEERAAVHLLRQVTHWSSIRSNSRARNMKWPGEISLRKALPIWPIPAHASIVCMRKAGQPLPRTLWCGSGPCHAHSPNGSLR